MEGCLSVFGRFCRKLRKEPRTSLCHTPWAHLWAPLIPRPQGPALPSTPSVSGHADSHLSPPPGGELEIDNYGVIKRTASLQVSVHTPRTAEAVSSEFKSPSECLRIKILEFHSPPRTVTSHAKLCSFSLSHTLTPRYMLQSVPWHPRQWSVRHREEARTSASLVLPCSL